MTAWSLAVTGTKNKKLLKNLSITYLNYIYRLGLGDGEECVYTLPIFLIHLISWMQEHSLTDWGIGKITYLGLLWTWSAFARKPRRKASKPSAQRKSRLSWGKMQNYKHLQDSIRNEIDYQKWFWQWHFSYNIKEKVNKKITGELDFPENEDLDLVKM